MTYCHQNTVIMSNYGYEISQKLKKVWTLVKADFDLSSIPAHHFFQSEWEFNPCLRYPSLKYVLYRGVFMLILLSAITFSTSCQSHLFHIFLTNWSFSAQTLYSILFFIAVFWRWWKLRLRQGEKDNPTTEKNGNPVSLQVENDGKESLPKPNLLDKIIWILINIVHVLPYCVVLGYWCVVYKFNPDQPFCEKFRSHYIVHGATAFLAFVDTMVIAIPARRSHFLIPTALVLVYVIFTFLYELAGGTYREGKGFIYSVLDWKTNGTRALYFSLLLTLGTPIAHLVFCWGTYSLRAFIKRLIDKNPKAPNDQSVPEGSSEMK